jgi:hypothetical protein
MVFIWPLSLSFYKSPPYCNGHIKIGKLKWNISCHVLNKIYTLSWFFFFFGNYSRTIMDTSVDWFIVSTSSYLARTSSNPPTPFISSSACDYTYSVFPLRPAWYYPLFDSTRLSSGVRIRYSYNKIRKSFLVCLELYHVPCFISFVFVKQSLYILLQNIM